MSDRFTVQEIKRGLRVKTGTGTLSDQQASDQLKVHFGKHAKTRTAGEWDVLGFVGGHPDHPDKKDPAVFVRRGAGNTEVVAAYRVSELIRP